jgi:DNA replication protein DnaC
MASETACPECGGSGWKIVERDELSGAERCDCVYGARAKRLEESAAIPPLYRNASFDNFALPRDNPIGHREMANVLLTVKGFSKEFPTDKRPGLLLVGEPGTGKTHLAVAALRILISRGFEGLFFDYQNLLDRIRTGYDQASGAADREAYRFALDAEVLMLDDLGAHRVTEWVEDTVTSIITYR